MSLDKYKEKNHDLVSGEFPRENRPNDDVYTYVNV